MKHYEAPRAVLILDFDVFDVFDPCMCVDLEMEENCPEQVREDEEKE